MEKKQGLSEIHESDIADEALIIIRVSSITLEE